MKNKITKIKTALKTQKHRENVIMAGIVAFNVVLIIIMY